MEPDHHLSSRYPYLDHNTYYSPQRDDLYEPDMSEPGTYPGYDHRPAADDDARSAHSLPDDAYDRRITEYALGRYDVRKSEHGVTRYTRPEDGGYDYRGAPYAPSTGEDPRTHPRQLRDYLPFPAPAREGPYFTDEQMEYHLKRLSRKQPEDTRDEWLHRVGGGEKVFRGTVSGEMVRVEKNGELGRRGERRSGPKRKEGRAELSTENLRRLEGSEERRR